MNGKRRKHKLGKSLRQYTGCDFVTCMTVARAVLNFDLWSLKNPNVKGREMGCCSCCAYTEYYLEGPKGDINLNALARNDGPISLPE